jgi:hypothetical protein
MVDHCKPEINRVEFLILVLTNGSGWSELRVRERDEGGPLPVMA